MAFVQMADEKPSVSNDVSSLTACCVAPTNVGIGYTVAVRELCAFAAKEGDLDLRFTPSPTAEEGIAGHRIVASRRGSSHRAEVTVTGAFNELVVRGRADGYDASRQVLEEVKTFKGDLSKMPANHRALHWAQAKVYGWLICREFGLAELNISLVYFDIGTEKETPFVERCSAHELRRSFETLCEKFLTWARREMAHRTAREESLGTLAFPHDTFRSGQRTLAENTYMAARLGRCLMAQAPTGIGKTVATLFPLLRAAPSQKLDKVFFLSAKTSGRAVALEAIGMLRRGQPSDSLRVLELVARTRACEHPDKACHGDSCPLANKFYDKLPEARLAAIAVPILDKESLRVVALAHDVCPYYLSQEMVRWADVIVCDYNYFFDSGALLHALTLANEWRVAVLVDEAHNLIDRARAMYTSKLSLADLRDVVRTAPDVLKAPLRRVQRAWAQLTKGQTEAYKVHAELPARLVATLRDASAAVTEFIAEQPEDLDPAVMRFYFDALQFGRLAESFGNHSIFDTSVGEVPGGHRARLKSSTLCIRNVVPASFLKPRFAAARTAVLFSATLSPQHFYADTLGLPENTAWLEVAAPFSANQLSVRIVDDVSTRYGHRANSLAPIANLMAVQYAAEQGNYMGFFSSFEYLQQVLNEFRERHPDVPVWNQTKGMDEREREAFLARFTPDGSGIAFAVLGGAFAEGIDLPGTRLIGAFVATLGLPQFNPVNEEMKRAIDVAFGAGYDYTYLFPGIRKVVQAAGRVIRTPSDRGHVILIDDRFGQPDVLRLLPSWWRVERSSARGLALVRSQIGSDVDVKNVTSEDVGGGRRGG